MERFIDVFGLKNCKKLPDDELYVMLMLQRSEEGTTAKVDCDDAAIAVACALDSDKCPAECKEGAKDEKEDTIVKSGDLAVKATPSTNRKAVATGVSDLDTITLKASEAITLNSVTLERYGYSDGDTVVSVWLEDENGTQITNPKSLSKDKVTLTLKKDYKELESTDEFTIVVELAGADGDIGFKVIDVDASAKNLDLSDYDPYTYQIVTYTGATITLTQKGKADTYNYEEGKAYEVQRFKAKAESTPITVYGFTLKDTGTVDLQDGVKDVEVTVNGEAVDGVKWEINSKEELKVNFDEVEIATRESATFAVNVTFVNGFEDLWKNVLLWLATTDFNAVEKKTGARVTVPAALAGNAYIINGGKITLTNKKLGNVEASAETDDVVLWEGEISIGGQAIVLNPFSITFNSTATTTAAINTAAAWYNADKYSPIKNVRMLIDGDETSATCTTTAGAAWTNVANESNVAYTTTCTFTKTIDIDEDAKIQFIADVTKYAQPATSIAPTAWSFGKNLITTTTTALPARIGHYDEANTMIDPSDFVGTIDLNTIKVQTPRGSLENTASKTAEFVQGKSDTQTIFKGKYTAKNRDVYLNSFSANTPAADFTAAWTTAAAEFAKFDELTLKVLVNGKEVATSDVKVNAAGDFEASDDFSKVLIEAGESADIEVKLQAYPNNTALTAGSIELDLTFEWEDADGNVAGTATESAVPFKSIVKGSISVNDGTYAKNSVALKKSNIVLAKFDLKPSKSDSKVDLESLYFDVTEIGWDATVALTDLKIKIAWKDTLIDAYWTAPDGTTPAFVVDTDLSEPVENNGITVEISYKGTPDGTAYNVTLVNVNDSTTNVNRLYSRLVMPVYVTFSQENKQGSTKLIAEMDKWDNNLEITSIDFYKNALPAGSTIGDEVAADKVGSITNISEGNPWDVEISWTAGTTMIEYIVITMSDASAYLINKADYNDYFKVGDTYLKIFDKDTK